MKATTAATALRLAVSDMWSEKIMTVCLALSIMAVVAPLMVLASLKVGFVDRLTEDLVKDPSFREIRPATAEIKDDGLFDAMRESGAFEFLAPTVMMVPREVVLRSAKTRGEARLLPNGADDPLLSDYAGGLLGENEAALSQDIAQELAVSVGDDVEVLVTRTLSDGRQTEFTKLRIVHVFGMEKAEGPTIVSNPFLDQAVEHWRSGGAVEDLGWKGVVTAMPSSFSSILLTSEEPLDQVTLDTLETRLGAETLMAISTDELASQIGWPAGSVQGLQQNKFYYLASRSRSSFFLSDVDAAPAMVTTTALTAAGLNAPLSATIAGQSLQFVFVDFGALQNGCFPFCLARDSIFLSLQHMPVFGAESAAWSNALAAIEMAAFEGKDVVLVANAIASQIPDGLIVADWRIGGILHRAIERNATYLQEEFRFAEELAGYRGFRAVAKDLDSVVEGARVIEEFGYPVISSDDAVIRLQRVDTGLNILVGVVSIVALSGGFLVLGVNFFANVQRKRLSYAILRLVGANKKYVFFQPLIQVLFVVLIGYGLAVLAFLFASGFINQVIANDLGFGGALSVLRPAHYAVVFCVVLLGAILACVVSAINATSVDPAVAMKQGS